MYMRDNGSYHCTLRFLDTVYFFLSIITHVLCCRTTGLRRYRLICSSFPFSLFWTWPTTSSRLFPLRSGPAQGLISRRLVNCRTQRVAIADFWLTSHRDEKISPGWLGWGGARLPPFSLLPSRTKLLYAPAEKTDKLPLFHL